MVDYSDDEKRAKEMVTNYFEMIEGITFSKSRVPSQDRDEMVNFLKEKGERSEKIWDLLVWIRKYDGVRGR